MRIRPDVKHVKLSDFPRTPWPVSFNVRTALMKAFNYCRQYPDKMMSLKAVLTFMQQRIAEWEQSAQTVEFEGGSQKRPMVSGTFVTPALTVEPSTQQLQKFDQPSTKHSDAIEMERKDPVATKHVPVNGALVAEVPKKPAMPHGNPLKSTRAPEAEVQPVEQEQQPAEQVQQAPVFVPQQQVSVGQGTAPAGAPSLAETLANLHQR